MMGKQVQYSPEVRERAVRLFQQHVHEHASRWAAMQSTAEMMGCTTQTLSTWVRRAEEKADPRKNASPRVTITSSRFTGLRPSEEIVLVVTDYDRTHPPSVSAARVDGIDKDCNKTYEDRRIVGSNSAGERLSF
jgi:transposase-like protein